MYFIFIELFIIGIYQLFKSLNQKTNSLDSFLYYEKVNFAEDKNLEYLGNPIKSKEMKNTDSIIRAKLNNEVRLIKYRGPEQMDVWTMHYIYEPKNLKIVFDCERGFLCVHIIDITSNSEIRFNSDDGSKFAGNKKDIMYWADKISDICKRYPNV